MLIVRATEKHHVQERAKIDIGRGFTKKFLWVEPCILILVSVIIITTTIEPG